MHLLDGKPVYSAGDLVGFLACEHLTDLERAALAGNTKRPIRDDPEIELIRKRGFEHEAWYIGRLEADGRKVTRIEPDTSADEPDGLPMSHAEEFREQLRLTREAIVRGDDVIYQAALFDGRWRGHADFLLRVDGPEAGSSLGSYHYEIADTKLARSTKASALLQLCTYVDLLTKIQGRPPESIHVALGGSAKPIEHHRVADYYAYYSALKARFEATVQSDTRPADYPPTASSPDPVEHCDVCRWQMICKAWWREHDSLSRVAGITRTQRRGLTAIGVETRGSLAVRPMPLDPPLRRGSQSSVLRVREQARIQVAGDVAGRTLYELLEPERAADGTIVSGRGLAALPPPSRGDLFFDIEGDPFAFEDGLEYLFGISDYYADGTAHYNTWWAVNREEEKAAFGHLVDFIVDRRARDPDLHVYHYGSYEHGRVARLSTRHATREEEVDKLLRGGVFVDLLTTVRGALRASVEGYSIKNLEPLYGFKRVVELRTAGDSIVEFERYLEEGGSDQSILDQIRDYNRDDCESAAGLRNWLETLRDEAARSFGAPLPRPLPAQSEAKPEASATRQAVQALVARLTADLPPDQTARTAAENGNQLLADMLDWHWREEKSSWWQFFDLMSRPDAELLVAREPIAGLTFVGDVPLTGRQKNPIYRYRFPPQETEVRLDSDVFDPRLLAGNSIGRAGTIVAIDQVEGVLDLARPPDHPPSHPTALVPHDQPGSDAQRESLLEIGRWVAEHGIDGPGPFRAARDLLLRRPPRVGQVDGATLTMEDEPGAAAALRVVLALNDTTLPIQGPPGSGKSTTGAEMIVRLVAAGRKVGITANSHKVISSLLAKVIANGRARGMEIQAVQKVSDDEQGLDDELVRRETGIPKVRALLDQGKATVAAGTAWLWSAEQMRGAVDVLFVDEAGQMALANAIATSIGARNLVLLGDPQQLDQPTQGTHPDGAGVSALEHVLAGEPTIDPTRGLFLESTWRLHDLICEFTSDQFYAGKLLPRPGLGRQTVRPAYDSQGLFGTPAGERELPVTGSGLRFVPVVHQGNSNRSDEEAQVVAELATSLVGAAEWTDASGRHRVMGWEDVLIVAPYNVQVRTIRELLPAGGKKRVGTVDKFQGQEGAVAIYSMTTSSAEEAPHGLDFLYSRNRLNVATSRARCLAVVVASPELTNVRCRTARQVKLVNALCRFIELAIEVRAPPAQAALDLVPA